MERFTRLFSATVLGTGNNNAIFTDAGKRYVFKGYYKLRADGENAFTLFFSNSIETTGSFSRGELGGSYRIKKAYAALSYDKVNECEITPITFSGKEEKGVLPGEIFSCDEFSFKYEKEGYLVLSFDIESDESTLLPTTNESASTGRIFVDGEEINPDNHSYRPCFIGIRRDFDKTVGFFGDSITQGTRTENDAYEAWAHRIGQSFPENISMWNIGMGWSRAYDAAAGGIFLEKAAMCDEVFMCFGVNDIKSGGRRGEEIIKDLERAAELMRERNPDIKIYFLTVPPFDLEEGEAERRKVNDYIKSKPEGEYFDIAAVLEDGAEGAVKKEYKADVCDAHPNGRAGEAVFRSFREWRKRWLQW